MRVQLGPKHVGVLKIKTLQCVHFIDQICNNYFTMLAEKQYCASGKIEKNEMGGACGVYGAGERCAQGSGEET
jgi:hypothetical protein